MCNVVEGDLRIRTTIWMDEVCQYRTERDHLRHCLDAYGPVDLLVLKLCKNDMKTRFHLSAEDIAQ